VYAKSQTGVFADVASVGQSQAYAVPHAAVDDPGVRLTSATFNLLSLLGTHPVLGRDFTRADATGRGKLALISYDTWQTRYQGRDDAVGQRLGRDGSVEIVGVLARGFVAPTMFGSWGSNGLLLDPDLLDHSTPADGIWPVVGRLAPGTSLAAAQAAIDALCVRVTAETGHPGDRPLRVLVETAQAALFHLYRVYLWLVVSAAASVLLVACANLASLLLARGRAREHVAALKTALGASTGRIVTGGLIECALVAGAGAAAAWVALTVTGDVLMSLEPGELRSYAVATTDARVVGLMLAGLAICIVASGAWPAWRASRVDVNAALQLGVRTSRRTRSIGARGLLAFEAALGVVLVSGAVLTGRSLIGVLNRDLGIVPANLYVIRTGRPLQDPAARLAAYGRVLETLRHDPVVVSAGGADVFTVGAYTAMRGFPTAVAPQGPRPETYLYQVTPDYFQTVGLRLVAGRVIAEDDARRGARVAVVSAAAVPLLWPGETPETAVGRVLRIPNEDDRAVVGVVANPRANAMRSPIAAAFVPYGQADPKLADRVTFMDVVVRTRSGASLTLASVRAMVAAALPQATVSMSDAASLLDPAVAQPRLQSYLFGSFALIALVLAAGGLFAVASLDVALRRYEMGVRMALGASADRLQRLVIAASLAPMVAGTAGGLLVAWWAGQFLQSLLVEGQARDPWMLLLSAAILIATGALAAWVPAHRASRVDPTTTLRAQ